MAENNNPFWEMSPSERRVPDPNRGSILPFYKDEDGISLGAPQWLVDSYNALTLPKDTLQGYQPTVGDTTNFALGVGLGGGASSAITRPEADLGMFLGRKAKGADTKKLAQAMSMAGREIPREEIWKETGWWLKPDGEWAFEISDEAFEIKPEVREALQRSEADNSEAFGESVGSVMGQASALFNHPEFFDNYQTASSEALSAATSDDDWFKLYSNTRIDPITNVRVGKDANWGGYFDPTVNELQARGKTEDDVLDVAIHELYHATSDKEGFEQGFNPESAAYMEHKILKKAPVAWKQYDKLDYSLQENMALRKSLSDDLEEVKKRYKEYRKRGSNSKALEASGKIQEFERRLSSLEDVWNRLYKTAEEIYAKPEVREFDDLLMDFRSRFGDTAFARYRNKEGEAIANLVSARRKLTESERIEQPPWEMMGKEYDELGYKVRLPSEKETWTEKDYEDFIKRRVSKYDNRT